ncbi:hypothetical protein ACB094_02G034500 [Castanea mollissima]
MASPRLPKIPIIDLYKEESKPGATSWLSACQSVCHALEEYGCFVAVYDNVSLELHNQIFGALKDLFDLPTETKTQDPNPTEYLGQRPQFPLYERLGIVNAASWEETQKFTHLMWPNGNHHFSKTAHSFTKLIMELNQIVTRMVFENYGVEKYYDSHMEDAIYRLRLHKYREVDDKETQLGLPAHTDKSFTTILHENHVPGLEIQTKDGQWIGFDSSPSSFLFLAGDAFMVWSNDRIRPCPHRVIMGGNQVRYSIGLQTHQKGLMRVPEELVDEEHPLQYKPLDHLGFLNFHHSNDYGPKMDSLIKAYCGV